MNPNPSAFQRDANYVPITGLGLIASKTITYAAGTTGATGASTLFTVTGQVALRVFALCSVDLTSGGVATLEVGIAGNTAALIAQTTATGIDAGEWWIDNGPATIEALPSQFLVSGNVIQTVGTTTITGGTLKYFCAWNPVSPDGNVVAA
jgi:hypothetical protein